MPSIRYLEKKVALKNNIFKKIFSERFRSVVFYICYALMISETFFRHTTAINPIAHYTYTYIAIPLLCILIVINFIESKNKTRLILMLVVAISIVLRFVSGNNYLLTAALFICAFKRVDFCKLIKLSVCTKIALLIILAFLYFNGLTDRGPVIQGELVRHSMGFGNPNTFSTHVLSIIIQMFYLHRNKLRPIDTLVFIIGVASIYGFTHSKTQIICAIIAAGVYLSRKLVNIKNGGLRVFVRATLCGSFVIGAIISLSAIFLYMANPSSMKQLDELSSKRLSSAASVIEKNNGIAPFGKKVDRFVLKNDNAAKVFDNGYAFFLLYYGIIPMLAFTILFCAYNKKSIKKDGGQTAWMFMVYAVSGITEHFFIEIAANVFLLKYSNLIYYENNSGGASC